MSLAASMVVAVAFLVRMAWIAIVRVDPDGFIDDMWWYQTTAAGIAAGHGYRSAYTGYPTAAWPPGYPMLLGGIYRLVGVDLRAALVVNAIAGTLTCVGVWWLARRVTSQFGATIAAALVAFLPSHVLFTSLVLSETVFTTALCALVLAAAILVDRTGASAGPGPGELPSRRRHAMASWLCWGGGVGVAALIRSEAVVLLLVPAAVIACRRRGWREAATACVAALAGAILLLTPWIHRNARVFGAFVPLTTSLGRTLEIGHNPGADGGMMTLTTDRPRAGGPVDPAAELDLDRALRRRAVAFAWTHPGTEAWLILRKLYLLYRGDYVWTEAYGTDGGTIDRSGLSTRTKTLLAQLSNRYYVVVMASAVAALVVRRRSSSTQLVMLATIAAWTLSFTMIYGSPRFHFPVMPFFCILAAETVDAARARVLA